MVVVVVVVLVGNWWLVVVVALEVTAFARVAVVIVVGAL